MMKLLFKLMFLICPIVVIAVLAENYLNQQFSNNSSYKLNDSVRVLILGHSHSECSMDDSLIDNTVNMSQSSESYFYTYYKLKKIIEANPKIQTVIVEFTNNIFNIQDNWTYDDDHLLVKYTAYSQLIPIKDKIYLLYKNPGGYLTAFDKALRIKQGLLYSYKGELYELYKKMFWGGYLSLVKDEIPKIKKQQRKPVKLQDNLDADLKLVSKAHYLKEIIKYCKIHDVQVILLRSPLHPLYNRRNEAELKYLLENDFKNIQFWDYGNYLFEDYEYGDVEHLNIKGAKHFSRMVNARLQLLVN